MDLNLGILICWATSTDASNKAHVATHLPLSNNWLSPYNLLLPNIETWPYALRIQNRLLQPRCLAFVATLASDPTEIVGYSLFKRLGNDDIALTYIRSNSTPHLLLFAWLWRSWKGLTSWILSEEKDGEDELEPGCWEPYGERWDVIWVVVRWGWRRNRIGN